MLTSATCANYVAVEFPPGRDRARLLDAVRRSEIPLRLGNARNVQSGRFDRVASATQYATIF